MRSLLANWRLAALIASAAMLAIAHGFETFGGYAPCELCLQQRAVYWAAGALALVFSALLQLGGGARWRALSGWVLAVVFAVGAAIAIYQAGAEWRFWPGPKVCSSAGGEVTTAALKALMSGAKVVSPPACDQPAWIFAGLSMAGLNALVSLLLAGLSAAAGWSERTGR